MSLVDINNPGIGCFLCHTPVMVTGPRNETEALENQQAHLYLDVLLHHMGSGLADNITQGLAQGDMFRSTPLWGIGKRLFFLHDGRTSDLLAAIQAHASTQDDQGSGGNAGYPPFGGQRRHQEVLCLIGHRQTGHPSFLEVVVAGASSASGTKYLKTRALLPAPELTRLERYFRHDAAAVRAPLLNRLIAQRTICQRA